MASVAPLPRRGSDALLEQRAPDWIENNKWLLKLHDIVYPANSQWYWYRRGKVSHSSLSSKYSRFVFFNMIMALASSGVLFPLCYVAFAAFLRTLFEVGVEHAPLRANPLEGLNFSALMIDSSSVPAYYSLSSTYWYIILQCALSGLFTLSIYVWNAELLLRDFYLNQKESPETWKCQPKHYLTPERIQEERFLGCVNACFAGVYGTGLFILHINHPFLQFYYQVDSYAYMFASALACYLWIDGYSYWMHKMLHTKFLYKNIHKIHHRYTSPTPYSAFALHPLEMICFQSAGILPASLFPMHIAVYLCVVLWIAYHNQVDHSGIDVEGDFPWTPSVKYHDDHHKYFHCNFGVHLVLWDWLNGTLRSRQRQYGEDLFVGEQDKKKDE